MEDFAVPAEAALLAGEELCLLFQQSSAVLVRIPFDLDDIHALVIGAHRHDVNLALPVVSLRVCVPLWVPLAAYRPVLQRLGKLCAEIPLKCVSGIGRVVIGHRLREQRILADLYHRLILLDVTEPEEQEDVADFITDGLSILPGQDRAFLGYEVIGLLQFRQLSPLCSSRQDTQICRSECYSPLPWLQVQRNTGTSPVHGLVDKSGLADTSTASHHGHHRVVILGYLLHLPKKRKLLRPVEKLHTPRILQR